MLILLFALVTCCLGAPMIIASGSHPTQVELLSGYPAVFHKSSGALFSVTWYNQTAKNWVTALVDGQTKENGDWSSCIRYAETGRIACSYRDKDGENVRVAVSLTSRLEDGFNLFTVRDQLDQNEGTFGTSVAFTAEGLLAVAAYEATNGQLLVYQGLSDELDGFAAPAIVGSGGGLYPSLVSLTSDGMGVAYGSSDSLEVMWAYCGSPECTVWQVVSVAQHLSAVSSAFHSAAVVSGKPVVAFMSTGTGSEAGALYFARSTLSTGSSGWTVNVVREPESGFSGSWNSLIVLSNGLPAISFSSSGTPFFSRSSQLEGGPDSWTSNAIVTGQTLSLGSSLCLCKASYGLARPAVAFSNGKSIYWAINRVASGLGNWASTFTALVSVSPFSTKSVVLKTPSPSGASTSAALTVSSASSSSFLSSTISLHATSKTPPPLELGLPPGEVVDPVSPSPTSSSLLSADLVPVMVGAGAGVCAALTLLIAVVCAGRRRPRTRVSRSRSTTMGAPPSPSTTMDPSRRSFARPVDSSSVASSGDQRPRAHSKSGGRRSAKRRSASLHGGNHAYGNINDVLGTPAPAAYDRVASSPPYGRSPGGVGIYSEPGARPQSSYDVVPQNVYSQAPLSPPSAAAPKEIVYENLLPGTTGTELLTLK